MYAWITRANRPPATGEASPLLQHLAGEFAPRAAGLWRAPHAAFLTAPAERRHLVCLALALAGESALPCEPNALLELPLGKAIEAGVPGAPDGLKRALGRLGELAWRAADYLRLLRVLGLGIEAKRVRHAAEVTPDQVRALAELPPPLLKAQVGGFGLSAAQARLLAEAHDVIRVNQGDPAAAEAVRRWAGARTAKDLFAAVQDDLSPEVAPAPFAGTARLRPLASKAAIREAAARFRNCLRSRIPYAVRGEAAYFEWTEPPGAVVEIWRDHVYGWRLDEARLARNASVPKPVQEAIVADLRGLGVHVGRTAWTLENALGRAHEPGFVLGAPEADVADCFGD
jgi:hypothetical protein